MNLIVQLGDGRSECIPVPEGTSAGQHLEAFLHRSAPFTNDWVELASGEYVRYSFIVSVRPPRQVSGPPVGVPRR